jgi:hypothetical protein
VSGLDTASMATIEDMVRNVRRAGIDVVAAAGNHEGAVDWPAGYDPVFAVGAADEEGHECAFAASGPEVDLWTSGCPLSAAFPDGSAAWASGSSESTAFVAAVLTQLRQLVPDLTVDQAERALRVGAQPRAAGAWLDVGAAFDLAGLAEQLAAGAAVAPRLSPSGEAIVQKPPFLPPPTSDATLTRPFPATPAVVVRSPVERLQPRLPRPSVHNVKVRHGVLTLSFANRPAGAEARVQIYARRRRSAFPALARTILTARDRLRTRVLGVVSQLSITYRDPTKLRGTSVFLDLRLATQR